MKRKPMKRKRLPAAEEEGAGRIIERPNGFYWQEAGGKREYGPFSTLAEAELSMQAGAENLEAESLEQAETEIGISHWIDPDTGGPAEDNIPRLEDH